jgi:predicted dehydrogenase
MTTRREFLSQSSKTIALTTAVSTLGAVHSSAAARDEPINIAIIGCGGIMGLHVDGLVDRKENVNFNWLCDVDPGQMVSKARKIAEVQSTKPKQTADYEDVANDKNVDAAIIATPHHWHAPIALTLMEAGKDVYVEKPISHVYNEGPLMIAAAQKYGRIVQQGSQMRNSPVTQEAARILSSGMIGDIKIAKAWTAELRSVVKPVPDTEPPNGVDYDRWLGPAPQRPFNKYRFHGTWRMFRDYANGEIGDDGIHDIDMACWGLDPQGLPKQVTARGGRMMLHGHVSEYPDNMNVTWEYEDGRILVYENYPFTGYGLHGFDNGNVFYGTEGYMIFSRRGAFSVFLGNKNKPGPTESKKIRGQRGYAEHMQEFLSAVRTRKATKANPTTAHYSCALVHLGEVAYRNGGQINFDPANEVVIGNDKANAMLTKDYRSPYGLS